MSSPERAQIKATPKAVIYDEAPAAAAGASGVVASDAPPRYTVWNLSGDFLESFDNEPAALAFADRLAVKARPWVNGKGERVRFLGSGSFELLTEDAVSGQRLFGSWQEVFRAANPPSHGAEPSAPRRDM